jgi:hypothetical protein
MYDGECPGFNCHVSASRASATRALLATLATLATPPVATDPVLRSRGMRADQGPARLAHQCLSSVLRATSRSIILLLRQQRILVSVAQTKRSRNGMGRVNEMPRPQQPDPPRPPASTAARHVGD